MDYVGGGSNPLTARVMVSRIWNHHFGQGVVRTPSNFGKMGAAPSHPELLDWLATEFVRQKWSVKQMHRLIMTSQAYPMSSAFYDRNALAKNPDAFYLWRVPSKSAWKARDRSGHYAFRPAAWLNLEAGGPAFFLPFPAILETNSARQSSLVLWSQGKVSNNEGGT